MNYCERYNKSIYDVNTVIMIMINENNSDSLNTMMINTEY